MSKKNPMHMTWRGPAEGYRIARYCKEVLIPALDFKGEYRVHFEILEVHSVKPRKHKKKASRKNSSDSKEES